MCLEERKKEVKRNSRQQNSGSINFIRALMSFEVVLCHCWSTENSMLWIFNILRSLAVPSFMFISFYLLYNKLHVLDGQYVKRRLLRLYIPYIGWGFIYFLIFGGIADLGWQLLFGHSPNLNTPLWFQFVLILLTAFYMLIFYVLDKRLALCVIFILGGAAVCLEYSGQNYQLFASYRFEICYPLGRICEMIPYATGGIIWHILNERLEKHVIFKNCTGGLLILLAILICGTSPFPDAAGFGYAGVNQLSSAVLLVIGIMMLDSLFEKMKFIACISKYSMGIFCMHILIQRYLYSFLGKAGVQTGTFFTSCLVYSMCVLVAWGVSKIPLKICKQLVT